MTTTKRIETHAVDTMSFCDVHIRSLYLSSPHVANEAYELPLNPVTGVFEHSGGNASSRLVLMWRKGFRGAFRVTLKFCF